MNTMVLYRLSLASLLAAVCFAFISSVVHAQVTSPSPYVVSSSTPSGVRVLMNLPNDYFGEVSTVCTNGTCATHSTSSPLTSANRVKIQSQIEAQQKQMDQFFAQQQQFFQAQEQLFSNMFNMQW